MADDQKQGAYAPPPDEFDTFDARYGDGARRGPLLLLVAGVLLVLVVALAWSSYNLGVRDRNGPPVITADAGPFRTTPDDPGGMEVSGAGLDVYELRDPETEARAVPIEAGREVAARPGPEEPAPLELDGRPDAAEAATEEGDLVDTPAETASAGPETAAPDPQPETRTPEAAAEPAPARPESAPDTAPEQTPAPTVTRPEPQAAPQQSSPPVVESSDGWRVQISAHRSQEEADAAWIDFVAAYPDLARGRAPEIVRADLGERGVYYRLRVTTAPSRVAATQFCDILKARGQDCLVVRG